MWSRFLPRSSAGGAPRLPDAPPVDSCYIPFPPFLPYLSIQLRLTYYLFPPDTPLSLLVLCKLPETVSGVRRVAAAPVNRTWGVDTRSHSGMIIF